MKKRIVVFIGAICLDNQRRVVRGILDEARVNRMDVYIFTCHVNYTEAAAIKEGAYNIMRLPDLSTFDGAIVMPNSIQKKEIAEEIIGKILESSIPAVSVEEKIEGMYSVEISNFDAQKKIMDHLLAHRDVRTVNYISVFFANKEGKSRLDAYRNALKERNIPIRESQIYYGDYSEMSGRNAVREFLKRDGCLPDAIVCANDAMAVGAIHELNCRGYQVPEDVIVTGFDNDELSYYGSPSLTSVDQNQEQIGCEAVRLLVEQPKELSNLTVPTRIFVRESCGCSHEAEFRIQELRHLYTDKMTIVRQASDSIKNMSQELAGLEKPEELFSHIEKYIRMTDMKSFYLAMCESDDIFGAIEKDSSDFSIARANTSYTNMVTMPVIFQNRKFTSYGKFPAGEVLPDSIRRADENATFYVVTPVHYQDHCYGYCVSEGSEFMLDSELAYLWIGNIGISFENIRKITLMRMMIDRLNTMWMFDTLTNIFNRGGFYYYANPMLAQMKKDKKLCYLLFLDLDDLKGINDNLGHEYGDACICEMAGILQSTISKESIYMRYGGDEFVVFGGCDNPQKGRELERLIYTRVAVKNKEPDRIYNLSVSIGVAVYDTGNIDNLAGLIELADKNMYEEKRNKGGRK